MSERADELEERMMDELNEKIATKSVLFAMAEGKVEMENGPALQAKNPGKLFLMGADPRLPKMPDKPTLIDFFNHRFASMNHLLQSATHAKKAGLPEKVVLACLLHDIGVASFIRCDHGYWGAQMIAPYVSEEIAWAVQHHQALRYFADLGIDCLVPFVKDGSLLGVLHLGPKRTLQPYSQLDRDFLNRLRTEVTVAYHNSLLFQNVTTLSTELSDQGLDIAPWQHNWHALRATSANDVFEPRQLYLEDVAVQEQNCG